MEFGVGAYLLFLVRLSFFLVLAFGKDSPVQFSQGFEMNELLARTAAIG